jgi:coenzyme F420-reducing hydrogenase beta subunit
MTGPNHSVHLIDRVIAGGYCVGCGACAAAAPDDFGMRLTETGCWTAQGKTPAAARAHDISALCPMSGAGPDETTIAAERFPDAPGHPEIGRHLLCGAGWVEEGAFRSRGSSGGMLSWLATRLLEDGRVDAVIHVAPNPAADGAPFAFRISETAADIAAGAKSRYSPVTLAGIAAEIRRTDRRVAFIGLPCFVKAMRTLAREDPVIEARVPVMLGLICGHLKSRAFAELLAWQHGMPPERLGSIDFREKLPDSSAASYGFRATDRDGTEVVAAPMSETFGGDWGLGLFKYKACDFCDDVLAECADAAVGDAWLPEYQADWRGTNVFVARTPAIASLIRAGRAQDALRYEEIGPDRVADSQRSGLRHRREGLAWRLAQADRAGCWRPARRIAPSTVISLQRRHIYDARSVLLERSHALFLKARTMGNLQVFLDEMSPYVARYRAAYATPPQSALRRHVVTLIKRVLPPSAVALIKRTIGRPDGKDAASR